MVAFAGGLLDAERGFSPGTKPSAAARSQESSALARWPTITSNAVVPHVQRLAGALDAIAQHGHGLVLENVSRAFSRVNSSEVDDFFHDTAKIDFRHLLASNYLIQVG
jgi:hypothetical protein